MSNLIFVALGAISGYYMSNRNIIDFFKRDDPVVLKVQEICAEVFPDIKNLSIIKSKESYTIDKERVYLCTEDKNGEVFSLNTLIYVLLHEYAHTKTDSIGHTDEFHKKFDEILDKASEMGLYDPDEGIDERYSVDGNCSTK